MPVYKYTGRSTEGVQLKGLIEGVSTDNAASRLQARGIIPLQLEESVEGESDVVSWLRRRKKITAEELIMFSRQMYTITRSGIPLVRSVRGIAATVHNVRFKETLDTIADRLETGMTFSVAMQPYGDIFGPMFISVIQMGEDSGRLDRAFKQLSDYLERDLDTRRQIKTALRYPSFVILAFVIALVVVNIWVIPTFVEMFAKFDAALPWPTRVLIAISNFLVLAWPMLLLVIGGGYYLLRRYIASTAGAIRWGAFKVKVPIIGDIVYRASLARYSRALSLMLSSGVAMNRALELSARAVDNDYMAGKIRAIRQGIERGENLLATHAASNMFTPLVLQMIGVGEESGEVSELLGEVAEFYEREVDYDVGNLTARIEPLLLVMLTGFALVLALGILLPIWQLYDIQMGG